MTDLRLALRLCLRHPVLSLAAVASLALGIGANTAIFTVLNGSVLQPLPYGDPARLMVVWETSRDNPRRAVAPANFLDWRRALTPDAEAGRPPRPFESLAAFDDFPATLSGQFEAQRVRAVSASANFFEVLRVQAQLGRVPTAIEDQANATPVAVLTDGLWYRLFGGSPSAIGQTLVINGITFTIVGVLPQRFELQMVPGAEVWLTGDRGIPRSFPFAGDITSVRDSHIIAVIGRIAEGVRREQAQAQATSVMSELSERYPSTNAGLGANVMPLHEEIVGKIRPLVVLLQIAVAVLLLIACANVAHLLLGQAAGRQSEMFVRVALGAERSRLMRQLLVETLLIALPGGVAGLVLAQAGIRALMAVAPANVPRLTEIAIDWRVLAFTCVMTLLTALIFGLGPAWQVTRGVGLSRVVGKGRFGATAPTSLRQGCGGRTTGTRRWHHALVVTELALAQVLLVGGGLMLLSFARANRVDLGFASEGRLTAEINLVPEYLRTVGDTGRIDPTRKIQFITRVIDRMSSTPGIRAAAASFTAALTGAPNRGIRIEGDPEHPPDSQPNADFQSITRDFFTATGIGLVRGRAFDESDRVDSVPVVIVNQALVDKYFSGRDPIGRVLLFGGNKRHTIVGIVASARYRSVEQPADPTFYFPLQQNDERWPFLSFTVWAEGGADGARNAVALLRVAVREADPQQPITRLRTIDEILDQSMAARRFNTWIVGLFAATALLLAAIGTYGVMAYAVASRTRELGLRAALGARPADLIGMILRQGAWLTMLATALGLASAAALTRFMASLLYDVAPHDPGVFALVAGTLTAVAILATYVPARRAMRVDPMIALREM